LAGVSEISVIRVEAGQGVQAHTVYAVLQALGLQLSVSRG
jgi:hypothetical protein